MSTLKTSPTSPFAQFFQFLPSTPESFSIHRDVAIRGAPQQMAADLQTKEEHGLLPTDTSAP